MKTKNKDLMREWKKEVKKTIEDFIVAKQTAEILLNGSKKENITFTTYDVFWFLHVPVRRWYETKKVEAIRISFIDEKNELQIMYKQGFFNINSIIDSGVVDSLLLDYRSVDRWGENKDDLIVSVPYREKDRILELISVIENKEMFVK